MLSFPGSLKVFVAVVALLPTGHRDPRRSAFLDRIPLFYRFQFQVCEVNAFPRHAPAVRAALALEKIGGREFYPSRPAG